MPSFGTSSTRLRPPICGAGWKTSWTCCCRPGGLPGSEAGRSPVCRKTCERRCVGRWPTSRCGARPPSTVPNWGGRGPASAPSCGGGWEWTYVWATVSSPSPGSSTQIRVLPSRGTSTSIAGLPMPRLSPCTSRHDPVARTCGKWALHLDEPTALPNGTELDLVIDDECDDLTEHERQVLHETLERSWTSAQAGELRAASALVDDLRRKR